MKRFLFILSLIFLTASPLLAQDDDDDGNEKIRDKMNEYIQKRLNLTNDEAKKFSPVFLKYFKEWRQTFRQYKDDALLRRQKVVELQLSYRTQFRDMLGEQRGNQVFARQDDFIRELKSLRRERQQSNPIRPLRRGGSIILR